MIIDMSKVNLTERDIEDWLYQNPSFLRGVHHRHGMVDRWIARQYRLPNGIADLIGVHPEGNPVVVEVKNVPITKAAVLQVCRYASDIDHIIGWRDSFIKRRALRVLVGPSIDFQTEHEAWACNVEVLIFACELNLTVQTADYDKEYVQLYDEIADFSKRPEWQMFIPPQDEISGPIYSDAKDNYDELMDAIQGDAEADNE